MKWDLRNIVTLVSLVAAGGAFVLPSEDAARLKAAAAMLQKYEADFRTIKAELKAASEIKEESLDALSSTVAERNQLRDERDFFAAQAAKAAKQKPATKVKANAKPTYDGPLAPVLRHELDGLRSVDAPSDGGASQPDGGTTGAEGGSGSEQVPVAPPAT